MKVDRTKFKEFKKELKTLLAKYSADIDCHIEGDTWGIEEHWLGVKFLEPLKEGDNFRRWTDLESLDLD